ncbi:hypothetical protein AOXY_G15133 [Acipenser oxyrinchus oxyrinchus]|uniref:TACI cysteine-rich domain-containing protein n=1 Tax=Acipenser oxyrinchus oxyrinchus TaxID=40147 RepID=A0AAD8DBB1_ACIOX|nr:hypothetical protein AOXY_G15133 [Acipenser oxyrinchus oxyrinchus]
MGSCQDSEYWDSLVRTCILCKDMCDQRIIKAKCTPVCEALRCTNTAGSYYDTLLRKCISCAEVCGQHPVQCGAACQGDTATAAAAPSVWPPMRTALELQPTRMGRPVLEHYHAALIYSLLGVCLSVLLCTLSLAVFMMLRKREEPCPRKKASGHTPASSKACLMESGSLQGSLSGRGTPEAVGTCGYCFPELAGTGTAVQTHRHTGLAAMETAPQTHRHTGLAAMEPAPQTHRHTGLAAMETAPQTHRHTGLAAMEPAPQTHRHTGLAAMETAPQTHRHTALLYQQAAATMASSMYRSDRALNIICSPTQPTT